MASCLSPQSSLTVFSPAGGNTWGSEKTSCEETLSTMVITGRILQLHTHSVQNRRRHHFCSGRLSPQGFSEKVIHFRCTVVPALILGFLLGILGEKPRRRFLPMMTLQVHVHPGPELPFSFEFPYIRQNSRGLSSPPKIFQTVVPAPLMQCENIPGSVSDGRSMAPLLQAHILNIPVSGHAALAKPSLCAAFSSIFQSGSLDAFLCKGKEMPILVSHRHPPVSPKFLPCCPSGSRPCVCGF